MKNEYYSFEDIKTKFKSYRKLKESAINEEEYDMFCDEIQALPREIVDKVKTEIQFVLLSAAPKLKPACYINLSKIGEKKGIIVLTPFIFGAPYIDLDKKVLKKRAPMDPPCILHEVAHHILRHFKYEDQQDYKEKEKAAEEQAKKWTLQYWDEKQE